MRRSEINRIMLEAEETFRRHGTIPPPWAAWSLRDWAAHPEQSPPSAPRIRWAGTSPISARATSAGAVCCCCALATGSAGLRRAALCEKLMIVREAQETPFHRHLIKVEDIINRGGGNLIIETVRVEADTLSPDPHDVLIDGAIRRVEAHEPIRLTPGESITLVPGQLHRFYGEDGRGDVLVGEVSQVNDDVNDNIFLEPVGRFATIEEDEPARHPLWSELAR